MIGLQRGFMLLALGLAGIGGLVVQDQPVIQPTQLWAQGLTQPVEIIRDHQGVPHIYAHSETDAYLALGYSHARDRLWQMDMQRRLGAGRLSELFGERTLEQDRFMRVLGIQRAAERDLRGLDASTRAILDAYAQGVNAYLAQGERLPWEYLLQRLRPAPWMPVDSLVWLKTMAWNLSGNGWEELLNLRLSRRLSPAQWAELFPPYPGEPVRPLPALESLYADLDSTARHLMALGFSTPRHSIGSNNWAVDGRHTQSGKPLLANDPHLKLAAPAVWYFAHLEAPGFKVSGATLPGVPAVALGRTEHAAWAFTNTGPDTQDIYVEQPVDPAHYRVPDGTAAFSETRETIAIKDAPDEHLTVRATRHGPVISDVSPEAQAVAPSGTVLALRWTGLEPGDMTLRFMLNAARARTGADIHAAAQDFHAPQQNIVYADDQGAIGFVAAGRVPVRQPDNELMGRVPAPGWDGRYDWTGFIPFAALPQATAPASGTLVTANQKITPPDYPYWITAGWQLPYRAERITHLLDANPRHDVASFAAIQTDVVNPVARQLLPYLVRIEPANTEQRAILARMRAWSGDMAAERAEPLIFAEWIRRLAEVLYRDALGDLFPDVGDYNPLFLLNVLSDHQGQSHWCGQEQPPCAAAIQKAFALSLDHLRQHYGPDPNHWTWGAAHPARSAHPTFGGVPLLSRLFNVTRPSAGGMDTVNVSGYAYDEASAAYIGEAGPSFRAIYDLADPDTTHFILSTGQSGDPLSPHYRDMAQPWAEGRYLLLTTRREQVVSDAEDSVRLEPF